MSASPFLASSHGHPAFNPVKMAKTVPPDAAKNAKNLNQPKPPDKPLMPYMRYSKKVWDDVRARYPDIKIWETSRIVGQMWRDLPKEDKQEYIDAFESEKVEYNEALKVYHSSPAYQSWIASLKTKENEERDTHKRKEKKSNAYGLNSPQKADGRISLQSVDAEMDDEDEYYSMKHLAAARFYRNHKLVTEVFSDSVVPDVRTIVTNSRLQVLRKQVESLTMHQNKLDEELKQLEDRFQEKKRLLMDSSEKFSSELNKKMKTVDDATYKILYEKALEQIRKEHSVVLTQRNDIQPATTTTAPESLAENTENKSESHAAVVTSAVNEEHKTPEETNLKVVAPTHESTDSNDSSHELHPLKENIPMQTQSTE